MSDAKVFVDAEVEFLQNGRMRPTAILWADGTRYDITGVTGMRHAPALTAGGMGDRYSVTIQGCEKYLFFEHSPDENADVQGRWFVEAKI